MTWSTEKDIKLILRSSGLIKEDILDAEDVENDFKVGQSAILEVIKTLVNKTLEENENDKKLLMFAVLFYDTICVEGREYTLKIIKESNLAFLFNSLVDRKLLEGEYDMTSYSIGLIDNIFLDCFLNVND